jgi:hypothetical protein
MPERGSQPGMPVDDLGHAVPVPPAVRRVVSLVPSLTETVASCDPRLLVGATIWCAHPADLAVTRIGGTKNPDPAAIAALAPDVVLANEEENRRPDLDALRAAGLAVWVTRVRSLPEALASLRRMLTVACRLPAPAWLDAAAGAWERLPDPIANHGAASHGAASHGAASHGTASHGTASRGTQDGVLAGAGQARVGQQSGAGQVGRVGGNAHELPPGQRPDLAAGPDSGRGGAGRAALRVQAQFGDQAGALGATGQQGLGAGVDVHPADRRDGQLAAQPRRALQHDDPDAGVPQRERGGQARDAAADDGDHRAGGRARRPRPRAHACSAGTAATADQSKDWPMASISRRVAVSHSAPARPAR